MAADQRLRRAEELYAAAAFAEAEALLLPLVEQSPRNLTALLLLGTIAARTKRGATAAQWFERALMLDPDNADIHVKLAAAQRMQRRFNEAIAHLERALRLQPRLNAAYLGLGSCYFESGDLERAGSAYLEALRIERSPAAALGLARVLREQRRFDLAERTLRTAAAAHPANPEILATLGILLHETGRAAEAVEALEGALKIDPRGSAALYYLGNLKRDLGRWDEAEGFYRRALAVQPDDPDTRINLADVVAEQGRLPDAQRLLESVRRAHGGDPDVRYACGIVSLGHGDFSAGWPDIASTVRTAKRKPSRFAHLPKLEEPAFENRKVIVWGDQGIGDEIIHGSLLQDLRAHAPHIVCEVDRRLAPLFRRGLPEFTFVERTVEPAPPSSAGDGEWARAWAGAALDARFAGATHHIPLPDLGGWLRTGFHDFPKQAGYLKADGARAAELRRALKLETGERLIGLSWRSHNKDIGRHKSLDLLQVLAALPATGLRFVNLQYGAVEQEIAAARAAGGRSVAIVPDLDCFADIEGLAALIAACDAVVTVSNVTAHLAGALGQNVGLLCPTGPGRPWYWFASGDDSPWYPSMRIFRQTRDASWERALADCAAWVSRVSL